MIVNRVGIFFSKNVNFKEGLEKIDKIIGTYKIGENKTWCITNFGDKLILETEFTIYHILFIEKECNMLGCRYNEIYYDSNFSKEYVQEVLIPQCGNFNKAYKI